MAHNEYLSACYIFHLRFTGFGTFVVSSGEPHSDAHFGHSTNVLVFVSSRKRHLRSLNPTATGLCTTFTQVHVHLITAWFALFLFDVTK